MRYVGSKKRLAARLATEIKQRSNGRSIYWEPFLGGANSFSKIAPMFNQAYGSDSHEDLILMWKAARDGWVPPFIVSETEYAELRVASPSALRGFVGFGGSFGGKWFGGYARGGKNADGTPRNHQAESARAVLARVKEMKSTGTYIKFRQANYSDYDVTSDYVVYCDPPYRSTLTYAQSGQFNHDDFWRWAERQHYNGALILVSEYSAPSNWVAIAEFSHSMSVSLTADRKSTVEKLFMIGEAK